MTTAECSRCRNWFKSQRGYLRFHYLSAGQLCAGSGLVPWSDPWDERASA
jgi:hypothetical protein